jgi:hypothetical protein
MSFWQRVVEGFVNSEQEELVAMLDEFQLDYAYEPTFIEAIPTIEELILAEDYNEAWVVFQQTAPLDIAEIDWELFEELLLAAYTGK